jgi:hypothetical protein
MARSRTSLSLSFYARCRAEVGAVFASVGSASALAAVTARATNARREIFDAMARAPVGLISEPCGAESSGSSIRPDYWTRSPITQSLEHKLFVLRPKRRPLLALRVTGHCFNRTASWSTGGSTSKSTESRPSRDTRGCNRGVSAEFPALGRTISNNIWVRVRCITRSAPAAEVLPVRKTAGEPL